ncbi:hypothetical protein HJC23_004255 [Cyclotella cryptica]|uniref:Uncharacterized protein n=1 Tax=Cyclotella cryptica TaxID=29204 RepID=A0ABD3Q852_9STRA
MREKLLRLIFEYRAIRSKLSSWLAPSSQASSSSSSSWPPCPPTIVILSSSIRSSVTEAKETIHQDVQTVNELADSQNSLLAVQFAGMFTILVHSRFGISFESACQAFPFSGGAAQNHGRAVDDADLCRDELVVADVSVELYESYCVYTFLSFLIAVLGRGDRWAVVSLLERGAEELSDPDKLGCPRWCWRCCEKHKRQLVPPASPERINNHDGENCTVATWMSSSTVDLQQQQPPSYLDATVDSNKNRHKAEAVLDQCQTYAMQFVLLRPITAIGWLVSNQLVQPESFLDWKCPQMYIVIITNVSIFFAFRGLAFLDVLNRSLFKHIHNLFTCLFLVSVGPILHGVIPGQNSCASKATYPDKFSSNEEATDFVARSQNFLICLEMLFAAVAHCFVFPPEEWAEGYREREESRRKRQSEFETHFGDSVALGDFIKDVRAVMASKRRRRLRKRKTGDSRSGRG